MLVIRPSVWIYKLFTNMELKEFIENFIEQFEEAAELALQKGE